MYVPDYKGEDEKMVYSDVQEEKTDVRDLGLGIRRTREESGH